MNSAKIIAVTQPRVPVTDRETNAKWPPEYLTPDEFIAYTARVSNPDNQMNTETAPKLIKYLINNSHWSPFEMVSVTMEIETTRDIARQILRHRSFSFQEFSQRYADPTKSLGFTTREARLQDPKNRQNSVVAADDLEVTFLQEVRRVHPETFEPDVENVEKTVNLKNYWEEQQNSVKWYAERAYNWAITNGIAKEQARAVLPEGLTVSRMYMAGTLRSWIHYCKLREKNGTQKEHMDIAKEAWVELLKEFPSLSEV